MSFSCARAVVPARTIAATAAATAADFNIFFIVNLPAASRLPTLGCFAGPLSCVP
jgi:hypothetical protein